MSLWRERRRSGAQPRKAFVPFQVGGCVTRYPRLKDTVPLLREKRSNAGVLQFTLVHANPRAFTSARRSSEMTYSTFICFGGRIAVRRATPSPCTAPSARPWYRALPVTKQKKQNQRRHRPRPATDAAALMPLRQGRPLKVSLQGSTSTPFILH